MGGSSPTTGTQLGVQCDGTITMAGTNTLNFANCLGGTGGLGANFGVIFGGTFNAGNVGTLNFTNCIGGSGAGGTNVGVLFRPTALGGATTSTSINFTNCVGGSGGNNNDGVGIGATVNIGAGTSALTFTDISGGAGGTFNVGVNISNSITTIIGSSIVFNNITGGGDAAGSNNHGIWLNNTSMLASTITARGVKGGFGNGNNYGVYLLGGVLGSIVITGTIDLEASSLGSGTSEYGIYCSSSAINVTSGGEGLSLRGKGGGLTEPTGTGTQNYGISFESATLVIDTGVTNAVISGQGGLGSGGQHNGVTFSGTNSLTLNNSTLTFRNCFGGYSTQNANMGIRFTSSLTSTTGTLFFTNIAGGGAPPNGSNCGIFLEATLSAPSIIGTGIQGGSGIVGDSAVYISTGGVLGSTTTTLIDFSFGSSGLSQVPAGFYCTGIVRIGDGGVLNLLGTGGTDTTLTGVANAQGVFFEGASSGLIIGDTTAANAFIAGVGAGNTVGGGSSNSGVTFSGNRIVLAPGSTLNFVNCTATLTNGAGVFYFPRATGSSYGDGCQINFLNCCGSGRAGGNGVFYQPAAGTTYGANFTLTFRGCVGGLEPGGSNYRGVVFAPGSTTYGANFTLLFDQCSGGGISPPSTGTNVGVLLQETGGTTIASGTVSFSNVNGGDTGSQSHGVHFATNFQVTSGSITLSDVVGGGQSDGGTNYGVFIPAGVTVFAPTITARGIMGGPGATGNNGFQIAGTLGSSSVASTIVITAGSLGTSTSNVGIAVPAGGQILNALAGTTTLVGTGGPGSISANYGISITGAGALVTAVNGNISLTGTAGNSATTNGIRIDTTATVSCTGSGSLTFNTTPTNTIGLGVCTLSTSTGNMTYNSPVVLVANTPAISTTSGTIQFASTIDGAFPLSIAGGTGTVTLTGSVGGSTALTTFAASANDINIFNNIRTSNGNITITGIANITGSPTINSGSGAGNISFSSQVVSGTPVPNLTLTAGTGTISIGGLVSGIGAFTITSSTGVTATSINVVSLEQIAGSNTTSFSGAVTTSGFGGISLTGSAFSFAASINTSSGLGPCVISNSGLLTLPSAVTHVIGGSFRQSGAGTVSLGSNITTTNGNISFASAVTLAASATPMLTTAATNGNSVFTGTVNATTAGVEGLTFVAGTGTVTFGGIVGGGARLGAITFTSASEVILGANVSSNSFTSTPPVSLTGAVTINTSALPGAISLTQVDGAQALVLNAGTSTVNVSRGIGMLTAVSSFTASASGGISLGSIGTVATSGLAGALTLNNTATLTGAVYNMAASQTFANAFILSSTPRFITNNTAVTFNGAVNGTSSGAQGLTIQAGTGGITFSAAVGGTMPLGAITLNGSTITVNNPVTTSGEGAFFIANNSALLSIPSTASPITLGGSFLQIGAGAASIGATIITTGSDISFVSNLTIASSTTFNSSSGDGQIRFEGTVDAANAGIETLGLTAGNGIISFLGVVGGTARLGPMSITSASNVIFSNNINANSFTCTPPATVSGSPTVFTNVANLPIVFGSTIDGAGNLTLNAGTSTVTMTGSVGERTPLTTLTAIGATITQSDTVETTGAISYTGASSIGGNITTSGATGTITVTGAATITAPSIITSGATSGTGISFSTTVGGTGTPNLTLASGASSISLGGALSGLGAINFNTGTGVTLASAANSIAGASFRNNIPLTISNALLTTIDTSSGNGNILFTATGTVDGLTSGNQPLTLTAGTGTITLAGAIGGGVPLGALILSSGSQAYLNAAFSVSSFACAPNVVLPNNLSISTTGSIAFSGSIDGAFGLTLASSGSTVTLTGPVGGITPLTSVSVSGSTGVTVGSNITTANGTVAITGPATLSNDTVINTGAGAGNISFSSTIAGGGNDLTLAAGTGSVTLGGIVSGMGALVIPSASALSIANNITATSFNLASGIPTTLTASSVVSTTGNGPIVFGGTINGSAPNTQNLTLNAGTGSVTLNSNVGNSVPIGTFIVSSPALITGTTAVTASTITFSDTIDGNSGLTLTSSGAIVLGGTVGGQAPLGSLSLSGSGVNLGNDIYTDNSALVFSIPITLTAPVRLNTGAVGGAITFNNPVNGASTLILDAGSGAVAFNAGATVGNSLPPTSLTIASGASVTTNAAASIIINGPITQTNISGNAQYNGTVLATGAISLAGSQITLANTLTSSASSVALSHTGALAIQSPISAATTFAESGGGTVSLGANVTSTAGAMSFSSPVTLTAASLLTSGAAANFNSTINGANSLTVAATGAATFAQALGGQTPLSSLAVSGSSINVGANQTVNATGGGTMLYSSPVAITAPVAFTNTGTNVMQFASTISGSSPLSILAAQAPVTVTGAVNLSGSGAGQAGGSFAVHAGGNITFGSSITTSGSASAATIGGNGGDVSILSKGSISIHDVTTSGGTGTSVGGNAGAIFIQPNETFTTGTPNGTVPNGTVLLGTTLIALGGGGATSGANGNVYIAPAGRTQAMSVATVFTDISGDNLVISAGNVMMGPNEAMTIFGNINITATGNVVLSDMVALNDITLTTGSVIAQPANLLISRQPVNLLTSSGAFEGSTNTHVLAGGAFSSSASDFTPSTLNVGSTTILSSDLQFSGTILNFDDNATPPIPPAPPVPSGGGGNCGFIDWRFIDLYDFIFAASIELAEMNPTLSPGTNANSYWMYLGCICCADKSTGPYWATRCESCADCEEERAVQFYPFLIQTNIY